MGLLAALLNGALAAAPAGVPLAAPDGSGAGFESLPADFTGVRFVNRLSPEAIVRNPNFMNGSGVALGDVDGDGRCDLYFPAIDGTNRLYLNRGGWRFEAVGPEAGVGLPGAHSTGAVLEDLDGDGDLDLLVTTMGGGPRCLRNEGAVRFTDVTRESGLAAPTGSTSLALGDVDGNGSLDLYVANYGAFPILRSGPGRAQVKQVNGKWIVEGPNADRLRVVNGRLEEVGEAGRLYRNDGNLRFRPVPWDSAAFLDEQGRPKSAPADFGLSAVLRDLNGDGAPDLYACNDFQSPDRLWFNRGDGNFQAAPRDAVRKFAFSSMGADFGDLDGDGNLDFFTVEMSPRESARRQRSLTGVRFRPHVPGRFDYRPEVPRNTLYRGNGDGSWSELAEYAGLASTDWSWQPLFLDADLDGREDVLVISGAIHDVQDRDTAARIQSEGRGGSATNVLRYPAFPSPVSAFRNRGEWRFEDVRADWGFTGSSVFTAAALADLDGDGDLDLVCNRLNEPPALYRNRSVAPRVEVRLRGLPPNTRGANARLRFTGGPEVQTRELVAGGRYLSGDDAVRTFAAVGTGPFTLEVTWRSGRVSRVAGVRPGHLYQPEERDAEQTTPAAVATRSPLFVEAAEPPLPAVAEPPFDDFARQPLLPRQLSVGGPVVAWLDAGADGRLLVTGAARGQAPAVIRFLRDGRRLAVACDWKAPDDVAAFTAWTAKDGTAALLATVGNWETAPAPSTVVMLRPAPDGSALVVSPFPEVPASAASLGPIASADMDGDGDLDLFVGARVSPGRYPESGPSRVFRQEPAGLRPIPSLPALESAGMVQSAIWSDLEGDGYPELVLACEWGPVRVFRNRAGTLDPWDLPVREGDAAPVPMSAVTGWWNSVAAGDFDGDGRLDLVTGNWGENTGYRASAERPLRLHFGDFTGSGTLDLLEGWQPPELAHEVPRRGLRPLSLALPALAGTFPTHAEFSRATVAEVLATIPAPVRTVTARELRSFVWLNRGDHWLVRPLPWEAQLAPVFGVSVADADGDGREDLLLAQNFHAFRMEWPRPDAGRGLILLGDGQGGFRPLTARDSGVRVDGEQRGAAVADFDRDGRPDWVDTQTGANARLFRNAGGQAGLRVRLRGPAGNPLGLGAVIQRLGPGGTGPVRELRAASGYGSVDSAEAVLSGAGASVRVRWPGGRVTETQVPAGVNELEISRP